MNDDIELRLWELLAAEVSTDCTRQVRLAELGCQRLPTHKEQITNIIAHWRNEGWVETYHGDARVRLTEDGKQRLREITNE